MDTVRELITESDDATKSFPEWITLLVSTATVRRFLEDTKGVSALYDAG